MMFVRLFVLLFEEWAIDFIGREASRKGSVP